MARKLSILGSTGSIGQNALKVVDNIKNDFQVVYLTAHTNHELLVEQALKYQPQAINIIDSSSAKIVENKLKNENIEVLVGREGLLELASRNDMDLVLNALVGTAGMEPTLMALESCVDVALSNKESLVMAGSLVKQIQEKSGVKIYPIDSEHSAIWQCLQGENKEDVSRILLTGSGGPFRTRDIDTFTDITPQEALKHPNWDMGNKITIDSATMMNKGLEIIEAYWLFDIPADDIEVVIHPQSIIHSMIEMKDGSVKAQLGVPDMKVPIQYALTYPRHIETDWERLDFVKLKEMTFEAPDLTRFPCIELAFESLRQLGTTPAVLNVANEFAVYRFLKSDILFTDIPKIVRGACEKHEWIENPNLNDLQNLIIWAKDFVKSYN
ncbi:MAG: 1-deoxy-D-xylulose-5-phosphate reductoisomerase [Candidatus Marinimicrobia bacterium]|jgi:1-deoxy-D-xylulose-5-phosphate reductoisomerase|nr:1-deoxy-D-xylulose-5-phosphate reductoisomerase [Candidatus Neomarinimicrobiota bacterium]